MQEQLRESDDCFVRSLIHDEEYGARFESPRVGILREATTREWRQVVLPKHDESD